MKLFKEICEFAIICYISCVVTKVAMNRLTFNTDYLIDSLFITFGATLGWSLCSYFRIKKESNK